MGGIEYVDDEDGRLDKEYLFRALLLPPVKEFIHEEREDLMDFLDIVGPMIVGTQEGPQRGFF